MTHQYIPVGNPEISIVIGLVGVFLIFSPFLISYIYRSLHRKLKSLKKEKPVVKICGRLPKPKVKVPKPKPTKPKAEDWTPLEPIQIPVRKIKKPKVIRRKIIEIPEIKERDLTREKLLAKWKPLLQELESKGEVVIDGNTHYGSLRGYDIVLKAKKELKMLGYKIKVEGDEKLAKIMIEN